MWQTLPLYTGVLHEKQAFSSEKYLNLQRDHIIERINQFDGKLYLEFGGKMLEDFHAARVLLDTNQTIRSSCYKIARPGGNCHCHQRQQH